MSESPEEVGRGKGRGPIVIIVNGRQKEWDGKQIQFDELVHLAFEEPPHGENTMFTVTYHKGHGNKPEGSMLPGDSVKLKEAKQRLFCKSTMKSSGPWDYSASMVR